MDEVAAVTVGVLPSAVMVLIVLPENSVVAASHNLHPRSRPQSKYIAGPVPERLSASKKSYCF